MHIEEQNKKPLIAAHAVENFNYKERRWMMFSITIPVQPES